MSDPTIDDLLGRVLGSYRIESLVGRGNRASVYRASGDGQEVAIRVFDRDLSADPDFAERFRAQGAALAAARHPNLLANSRYAHAEGHAYIVRPYVAGRTLRDLLGEPLPVADVLRLLRPVATALDFVHDRGLVHGDVKPGNILLAPDDGATMLADLGVAQLLPRGNSLLMAATGRNYGTPEYLSPEQAQGQPLDGRTDGYALAIILYEALVGRPPFRVDGAAETPRTVAARQITAPPPKPRALNPALGSGVEAALLRGLDKNPARRFPSCTALLDALDGARDEQPRAGAGPAETLPQAASSVPGLQPPAPPGATPAAPAPAAPMRSGMPCPTETLGAREAPAPHPRPPARPPLAVLAGSAIVLLALVGILVARAAFGVAGAAVPTVIPGTIASARTAIVANDLPATATVELPAPTATIAVVATATAVATTPPPTVVAITPAPALPPVLPAAATPAAEVRREVILFASRRGEAPGSQIYLMNPDGGEQRQLISTPGHSWGPRVSPDGKFSVFSSVAPGVPPAPVPAADDRSEAPHEVFRARADGSDIAPLTATSARNNAWAWAPDGQSLVIASDRDGGWDLYRIGANGEGEPITRLTDDPAPDGWPSFTPDGRRIVFASERVDGLSQIYIMDADGGDVRRLNYSESADTLPSVSPDGRKIAYAVQTGLTSDIYVMDIDGANATRLTTDLIAVNTGPSWSPDGTRIVFSSNSAGSSDIYVMNAAGGGVQRLTSDPGEDVTPFWAIIQSATGGPVGEWAGRGRGATVATVSPLAAGSPVRPFALLARQSTRFAGRRRLRLDHSGSQRAQGGNRLRSEARRLCRERRCAEDASGSAN